MTNDCSIHSQSGGEDTATVMPTQPLESSDEQLACNAQAGSLESFDELARRFQTRLLQYLLMLTKDSDLAEDLLQDTFLRAYRSIATYRSKWRFSTWIYTIARHAYLKHLNKTHHLQSQPALTDQASYEDTTCERADFAGELWSTVRSVVTADGFTALWMFYVDDASIAEISRVIGKTQAGTKMLLCRLRRKIRVKLQPFAESLGSPSKSSNDQSAVPSAHSMKAA